MYKSSCCPHHRQHLVLLVFLTFSHSSVYVVNLLPRQTGVRLPTCSKANLLTLGFDEGKCSIYCRAPSKESRELVLKRPPNPQSLSGKGFSRQGEGGGFGVCDQLMDILLIGWW